MEERLGYRIIDFAKRPDVLENELDLVIQEEVIMKFCGNCEFLQEDNICKFGVNDQTVYVSRSWCGWAMVNGERGQMTADGFIPYGGTDST